MIMGDSVKKLIETTKTTSLAASDYMLINQGNTDKQVQVQKVLDLQAAAALQASKDALLPQIFDGIFIMYHNTSGTPLAVSPLSWSALQSAGEIADGVLVVRGDKHLVISPTQTNLYWSSSAVAVGALTSDRLTALNDWDGKTKTAAICANATLSADGASYAPGWCHAYSRSNSKGVGLTAGKWWLPSIVELAMIWSNKRGINAALAFITGATLLSESWYWSSTEASATDAWGLGLDSGYLNWNNKVSNTRYVRAVSAFIN